MKKLTLILALAVAAIATAGQFRHPANPLTMADHQVPVNPDFPFPACPPACH